MARVTVEDCLNNIDNRFNLVLTGTKRARALANGADAKLDWENDKPTVVALREIAEGLLPPDYLQAGDPTEQTRSAADEQQAGANPNPQDEF